MGTQMSVALLAMIDFRPLQHPVVVVVVMHVIVMKATVVELKMRLNDTPLFAAATQVLNACI